MPNQINVLLRQLKQIVCNFSCAIVSMCESKKYTHTDTRITFIYATCRFSVLCSTWVINVTHYKWLSNVLQRQRKRRRRVTRMYSLPLSPLFAKILCPAIAICNYPILYAVKLQHAKVNKTVGSLLLLLFVFFVCLYMCECVFHSRSNADYSSDRNLFRSLHYKWIIKSSPDICDAISVVSAHSKFGWCFFPAST